MLEFLTALDDFTLSLREGLIYRTETVSFKFAGEVFELPNMVAQSLLAHAQPVQGELSEMLAGQPPSLPSMCS